jgi:hypothetical protein
LITITRRLAQQLRSVLRRAFGNFRGNGPAIGFIADKEGLTVRSIYGDVAIECRLPGERPAETLWLPFEFLADVAGKNDSEVELEASGDGQVSVQWRTGNVPQVVNYDSKAPTDLDKFPALPTVFTANHAGLLQALDAAAEVAAHEGVRYATDCIQLAPDGTINATDGCQALIQSGFEFPWQDAALVRPNKVFTSPELSQDQAVAVAKSGDWVVVSAGRWTIYLRSDTRRYPKVADVVPDPETAKARCQFSKDDIRFLVETLPQLPCDKEDVDYQLTIDLNGHIALRVKGVDKEGEKAKTMEVVLTNSRCTGEPIRINTNRRYLQRAMTLGLNDLSLYGENAKLFCQGFERKFVWMPLGPGSSILPANDAVRIESPQGEIASPISEPVTPKEVPPMSVPTTTTTGKAASNGKAETQAQTEAKPRKAPSRKGSQQDIAALIDQAVKFRTALHDLMHESSGLVKALKQHRRQNKAIQNTLASLKQLKTLGV